MRTNECIKFEMYGHKKIFGIVWMISRKDLEQSLFDRCIDFLNTPNI